MAAVMKQIIYKHIWSQLMLHYLAFFMADFDK